MSISHFIRRRSKPRKKGNTLTLFGNQKGGVGKSTTCIMFANYLTQVKGISLVIIDADPQHSIYKKWEQDLKDNPNAEPLYEVMKFDELDNEQATLDLINDMREQDFDFLIDTPGNMSAPGMIHLVHSVDAIVTPIQYEKTCARSTNGFIDFTLDICEKVKNGTRTLMLFLPNMFNKNWGKKDELAYDKETEDYYNKVGFVLPKIIASPEIRRYSSLGLNKKQRDIVGPCFEKAWTLIYVESKKEDAA